MAQVQQCKDYYIQQFIQLIHALGHGTFKGGNAGEPKHPKGVPLCPVPKNVCARFQFNPCIADKVNERFKQDLT